MPSREEFKEAILAENPTKEQLEIIKKMQDYVESLRTYEPYTSPFMKQINHDYDQLMIQFQTMPRHDHTEEILKNDEKIQNIISMDEVRALKKEKEKTRVLKKERWEQRRLGFTNASILLFVVFNLGFFLAFLILFLR